MSDSIVTENTGNSPSSTILLVDDEDMVRHLLSASLTRTGFTVAEASDAEGALAWMVEAQSLPKLLVTDIDMPGMTGIELARRTRSIGHCPVLLISGKGAPDDAAAEGWEFLAKPFPLTVFVKTVERMLNDGDARADFECGIGATSEHRGGQRIRKLA